MKTIFKAVQMTKAAIGLTLSFKARVTNASGTSLFAMAAADIPALGIRLISNGVSGFADLIASGAAVVSGSGAVVTLSNLAAGVHRLLVVAEYGTNTRSLFALDITVPGALAEGTQEIAENVIVIETIGDGAEETIVDDELSQTSVNPVQNKVVTAALAGKADATATENALAGKAEKSVYGNSDSGAEITGDRLQVRKQVGDVVTQSFAAGFDGSDKAVISVGATTLNEDELIALKALLNQGQE